MNIYDAGAIILLSGGLESTSWSDYMRKKIEGFHMYKNLKMPLHSQMNPISHLK